MKNWVLRFTVWLLPAFLAGTMFGRYGLSPQAASQNDVESLRQERDEQATRLHELQHELSRIAVVDFAEYRRLQNEEAQFKKAKEILGKVFLILFHNVLSNVDDDEKQFAQSLAAGESGEPAKAAATPSEPPAPSAPPELHEKSSVPNATPVVTPTANPTASWTLAEKDLGTVNPEKAEAILQSTVIKDILSEQNSSRKFRDDDTRLQSMQGFYSGEITFLDPKRKPWLLEMDLSSETRNGHTKGSFSVRIVDDKGQQSRLGEEGNIHEILLPASESKAILVRVYKTQFLQMYIFEKQGLIIGNYYDDTGEGKVAHLGRFKLRR